MKARLRIFDHDVLTAAELVERLKHMHGCQESDIEVLPDSDEPIDYISFGISQLITPKHLDIFFESGALYPVKLEELRRRVLEQLEAEVDRVIMQNEAKLTGD